MGLDGVGVRLIERGLRKCLKSATIYLHLGKFHALGTNINERLGLPFE